MRHFKNFSEHQELNYSFNSFETDELNLLTINKSKRKNKMKTGDMLCSNEQFDGFLLRYILNKEKLSLNYWCQNLKTYDRPIEKFVLDYQNNFFCCNSLENTINLFLENIIIQIYEANYTLLRIHQTEQSRLLPLFTQNCITAYKSNQSIIKKRKKIFKRNSRRKSGKNNNKRNRSDKKLSEKDVKDPTSYNEKILPNNDPIQICEEKNSTRVFVRDIIKQRFNFVQNTVYLTKILTNDAHDEYNSDWSVNVYVEQNVNANKHSYIERIKEELVTGLLESHFPKHTSITFVQLSSVKDLLSSWEADNSVVAVFPHQRLSGTYTCILVLSQCSAMLLRHPHLAFYETLSQILRTPVQFILTAVTM